MIGNIEAEKKTIGALLSRVLAVDWTFRITTLSKKYYILFLLSIIGVLHLDAQLLVWPDSLNFGELDIDSLQHHRVEVNFKNTSDEPETISYSSFDLYHLFVLSFSADSAPPAIIKSVHNAMANTSNFKGSNYIDLVELPNDHFTLGPGEVRNAYIFLYQDRALQAEHQYWQGKRIIFSAGISKPQKYTPVNYNFRPALTWGDSIQNLGHCKQGDTVKAVFHYTNTTGKTLFFTKNPSVHNSYTWTDCRDTIYPYSKGSLNVFINTNNYADMVTDLFSISETGNHDVYYNLVYNLIVDSVKNYAHIEFEQTRIYRKMSKGDEGSARYYFNFKNTGTIPLIITSCHSSCSCLSYTCPYEPILPGQSGTIIGKYDVNRVGEFTKLLTVWSNDRYKPNITLFVNGEVIAP